MIAESRPASTPPCVLIVDDEPHNRELLEAMLAPDGFQILHAASGEEALDLVARQKPDLILLDVLMPGMDGYEVASQLKTNLISRDVPVIMVTALDAYDAKLSGLATGAEDFLSRPVDRAELTLRVRNLLRLKSLSDLAVARRDDSMGMVSHDLRGLLSGILLTAATIVEQASDSAEGRRAIEGASRIKRYATRMDRLVGDLVDVVRIDGGKLALDFRRCDAITLLREMVEAFAHGAADQGISLELQVVEPALVADLDRERLLQVVSNLLSNALKFTPPGGSVVLRGERSGDLLHFSITDTGTGIPAHMIEAIFERFQQAGDNDKRGLGLGLYIARCIVESHGGRIWAESVPGDGSTFHFTIPATTPAALDAPARAAGEGPPSARVEGAMTPASETAEPRGSILVVDDDQTMCETVAQCLVRRGFTVAWRTSAREALALLGPREFDAIFTDLHMEGMDGLALCRRVAEIRGDLPVVVCTALRSVAVEAGVRAAGAFELMTKPFEINELCRTLDRAVAYGRNAEARQETPVAE